MILVAKADIIVLSINGCRHVLILLLTHMLNILSG